MSKRKTPCKLARTGDSCSVFLYVDDDGGCQIDEFFQNKSFFRAKARFDVIVGKLSQTGKIANTQHFRLEGDGIWGIKLPNQVRVACFPDGKNWVCTHVFRKNGKWRKEDLKTAKTIRELYFERKRAQ